MHEIEDDVKPDGLKRSAPPRAPVGQTYTTAINLPSDFFLPALYIYVGTTKYYQVPFELTVECRDSNGFFYVNTAAGTYHLCGVQASVQTITFPYFYATADLVLTPSPEV